MSTSIDQQFIEFIVKSIVSNPDAVEIKRTIDEKGVLLELTVDQADLGRVIGKRGAGAQSLRTLLRSLGTKNDARYNLKIVDVGEKPGSREDSTPHARTEDRQEEKKAEKTKEESEEEQVVDEPAEAPAVEDEEETSEEGDSMAEKTRRELADLDDLDI